MGKNAAKRKAKAQTADPVVEALSKELSILWLRKLKDSDEFAKYVEVQASKVQALKEAIAVRERQQRLKYLSTKTGF